jgi:hypothetical protein
MSSPPEPWDSFLKDLNATLAEPVDLVCLGGFVMTQLYGLTRQTSDIDVLEITPASEAPTVSATAGLGSPLSRKYKVYLQYTAVQTVPENFHDRLIEMFPGCYSRLRLLALDPYDLALSKLERNTQRDRDDVLHLARIARLDPAVLQERYTSEMRPYLCTEQREDLTLKLWIEMIRESS